MPLTRSENMARIRSRDTAPELKLRRALHAAGLRYRLHAHDLPGKPDVVFRPQKLAIFVHGCFWHRHEGCRRSNMPKSRQDYWRPKLERNVARDELARTALEASGWTVLILWECESLDVNAIEQIVSRVKGVVRP